MNCNSLVRSTRIILCHLYAATTQTLYIQWGDPLPVLLKLAICWRTETKITRQTNTIYELR